MSVEPEDDDDDFEEDDEREEILPFETWSALSVELIGRKGPRRARILADAKVTAGSFTASERHWGGVLAAEQREKSYDRAIAYGEACAAAYAAHRTEPELDEPVVAEPEVAAVPVPSVHTPSFMLDQPAPAVVDLDRTVSAFVPARPVTPFVAGVAHLPASDPRTPPATQDPLDTTLEADVSAVRPALPFVEGEGEKKR